MAARNRLQVVEDTPRSPSFELRHRLARALEWGDVGVSDMARAQRCSRTTISNWLHNRSAPPYAAVTLWAERTGVSAEWLAGDDYPEEPTPNEVPSTIWLTRSTWSLAA